MVNSLKVAFIFPGQGAQAPGMGKALYEKYPEARQAFDQAGSVLGFDLKKTVFEGSEDELKQTHITQPAIFTMSAAAYNVLAARAPGLARRCAFVAGHSLGEYSALYAAGAFDFQTGIKLVKYRGDFISRASEKQPGTMAAILGVEKNDLDALCQQFAAGGEVCQMVNFNCPGQIVVAGTRKAVEALAAQVATRPGARAVLLSVSGPFHSSLMNPAAREMAGVLKEAAVRDLRVPIFSNCDAQAATEASLIKEKLVRQIDHPVLWEDSIRKMIDQGVEAFVEIGPGKVLSGLLRKIDRKKKALNVEDDESLTRTLQELDPVQSPA